MNNFAGFDFAYPFVYNNSLKKRDISKYFQKNFEFKNERKLKKGICFDSTVLHFRQQKVFGLWVKRWWMD